MISSVISRKIKTVFRLTYDISTKKLNTLNMSTYTLLEIVEKLNDFAPLSLAESWDNVGLLIEPFTPKTIGKIFLTNDLTESVMKEAINVKADLIISYHPPIFTGLKRITQNNWKERIVSMCLENRIALYSPHTAWDSVNNGVNDWLAKSIPSSIIRPIVPHSTDSLNVGAGRYLEDIKEIITLKDAIERVKQHVGIKSVHVSIGCNRTLNSEIKTVAICAGSGGSVLKPVTTDLYITGEMSHHDVLDAVHRNISVILCNHSNSERGYLNVFKELFTSKLNGSVDIIVAKTDADPLVTY